MNQAFDPLNIIILVVAVVIFWRLRRVLGTRTGNEKRIDPFSAGDASQQKTEPSRDDNVITLPGRETAGLSGTDALEEPEEPIWSGFAKEGSKLAKGLEEVAAADRGFSPKGFLDGAKIAYEMIVSAFAAGDKKALKDLLSKEVFSGFASAIDQRATAGEVLESQFVGIDKAELLDAGVSRRRATLTVRFISDMISATRDRDGKVIDGDPKQVRKITDVWSFEHDITSRDPNWKLSATGNAA